MKKNNIKIDLPIYFLLLYPILVSMVSMFKSQNYFFYFYAVKLLQILMVSFSVVLIVNLYLKRQKVFYTVVKIALFLLMLNSVQSMIYGSFIYSTQVYLKMIALGLPIISWWILEGENLDSTKIHFFTVSVISVVMLIIIGTSNNKQWRYEQGLTISYVLILAQGLICHKIIKSAKLDILDSVTLPITVLLLFMFSSRTLQLTTILLIAFTFITLYLNKLKENGVVPNIKRISGIIAGFSITSLILIYKFSSIIYNFLLSQGIYVRLLRLISEGQFFNSGGRIDRILPVSLKLIFKNPFGIGFGSERIEIGEKLGLSNINTGVFDGAYSHNLLLEIMTTLGIVTIVVFVIFFVKKVSKRNKNIIADILKQKELIVFMIIGLLPLFLTSSFTVYRPFWFLIGCIIYEYIKKGGSVHE